MIRRHKSISPLTVVVEKRTRMTVLGNSDENGIFIFDNYINKEFQDAVFFLPGFKLAGDFNAEQYPEKTLLSIHKSFYDKSNLNAIPTIKAKKFKT